MAISKLQALSNGRYKSVWHRAVVNSEKERMSIASFLCPCNCAIISPPEKLISEASPAMYRSYTYEEYYKNSPLYGLYSANRACSSINSHELFEKKYGSLPRLGGRLPAATAPLYCINAWAAASLHAHPFACNMQHPISGFKAYTAVAKKATGHQNIRQPTMYYSSSSTASLQKPSELPMLHIIIISHFRRMPKAASRWAPQQKRGRLCVVRPKSSEIRAQFF
ncbi:hypothetical protein BHM03_00051221 [Ensete ventricosum]|nr:hypothetical protein BHM03_00051221 [Ensete ventricosum]